MSDSEQSAHDLPSNEGLFSGIGAPANHFQKFLQDQEISDQETRAAFRKQIREAVATEKAAKDLRDPEI